MAVTEGVDWRHYCIKFESNVVHMIVDGSKPVTESGFGIMAFSGSPIFMRIGNSFDSSNPLQGLFSDFNVWSRLLTSAEIGILSGESYFTGDIIRWPKVVSLLDDKSFKCLGNSKFIGT